MWKILLARAHQGHRTTKYPAVPAVLPERFRGTPTIDAALCPEGCRQCLDACQTQATRLGEKGLAVDLGSCLFCTDRADAGPTNAVTYGRDYRLSARTREELVVQSKFELKSLELGATMRRLFGRSLKLRQVSAGGCNACEADVNVLGTIAFDLGRLGIQMVASPRHADGLLITGPVTQNMKLALERTWQAAPKPRLVIAVGAGAISGGP